MNPFILLTEALNISKKTAGLRWLFTNPARHTADTTVKSQCIGNQKIKNVSKVPFIERTRTKAE